MSILLKKEGLEGVRPSGFPARAPQAESLRACPPKEVVVVGGGLSGLTSALRLSQRGFSVRVLEADDHVGGMAVAFKMDGVTVEHGSHAFFGYYKNSIALCKEAGTFDSLLLVPGWTIGDSQGRFATLTHSPYLPTGLDVAPSIMRIPWLSFCDKLRTLLASARLMLKPFSEYKALDRYTALELGEKMGYSEKGAKTWNAATLGLSNQFVDDLSGALFTGKHRVLIGSPGGLTYHLPSGSISQVLAEPLRFGIEALGGAVQTGAKALGLERKGARTAVTFTTPEGERAVEADYVILALQPWQAKGLLPSVSEPWTTLVPVTPVFTMTMGLSGRIGAIPDGREFGLSRRDWVFSVITDLSRFWPEFQGSKSVLRVEVGHADLLPPGITDAQLAAMVKADLDRLFPETQRMAVEFVKIHRETQRLYVSWEKDQFAKKPLMEDRQLGNVFLAGDWTTKGTIGMEAAVNSAYEAVNFILAREGLPLIVFPDVPIK